MKYTEALSVKTVDGSEKSPKAEKLEKEAAFAAPEGRAPVPEDMSKGRDANQNGFVSNLWCRSMNQSFIVHEHESELYSACA